MPLGREKRSGNEYDLLPPPLVLKRSHSGSGHCTAGMNPVGSDSSNVATNINSSLQVKA